LRASLAAEYPGLPTLRVLLSGRGGVDAVELADYVAYLPPGCALWRYMGGDLAWSDESRMLSYVLHASDLLVWQNTAIMTRNPRGSQPKPMQAPTGVGEALEAQERLESKREKRHARRAERKRMRASE
jgi:hypothetical protein